VLLIAAILFSACGNCRSSCNTKNKTRTDMGWM
jgi:hypothetical protein